jgi:CheY-like chemotaxis protein
VLRLPVIATTPNASPVVAPAEPALGAPRAARVLIVEDNRDAADTLQMLLDLSGHEATVANDGNTALAAARDGRFDLLLIDIGLPGLDGYGVAEAIRRDPTLRGATLVALTGYGRPEDRERVRAAGFDHHLVKPVDLAALTDVIGRSLASRSSSKPDADVAGAHHEDGPAG